MFPLQRGDNAGEPVAVEHQTSIGAGNERARSVGNGVVAPGWDIVPSADQPDTRFAGRIGPNNGRGGIAASTIVDHDFIGGAALGQHGVDQVGDVVGFVPHGADEREGRGCGRPAHDGTEASTRSHTSWSNSSRLYEAFWRMRET